MEKIFYQIKKSGFKIFGPKEQGGELYILELDAPPPADNLSRVSDRPWKYFFTPERETLYKYEGGKARVLAQKQEKRALFDSNSGRPELAERALFGMSIFDCKALELYDKVFSDDVYYQQNRKNIFVVGYSPAPLEKLKTIFFDAANILESAVFDIFIDGGKFFARGKRAEKILKSAGIKYKIVPYKKHEPDKKVIEIMKAMEKSKNGKLWDELGEICLACGKCTIACPTCYCFDLESKIGPDCQTERCSGNCFYDDFTRIAGGHKFLNNPKEKIFFWYYHKFVRILYEYGLPGCVDCGRCTAVCPAGIDIEKNIERLLNEGKKKK